MKFRAVWFLLALPGLVFGAGSAEEVLRHTAATYRNLKSYEVQVTVQTVRGTQASERHFKECGAGPGKFRVEPLDGHDGLRLGDGTMAWVFRPESNEYSKAPVAADAGTHIGALAQIDQHVQQARIAREEQFLADGKLVPIHVIDVTRDLWPKGSLEGSQHTMYRIDQKTFVVYKAITYSSRATEIVLYSGAKWNQPISEDLFHWKPPESAREAASAAAPKEVSSPIVGAVAPDFSLRDVSGRTVNLHDLRGKVVIVDFWATWCGPCQALMPRLQTLYRDREKDGLVVLGLDVGEDAATVDKFARKHSYTFPLLLGSEPDVSARYYVEAYPTTFVVDRRGQIVSRDIGGDGSGKLEEAVDKALAAH